MYSINGVGVYVVVVVVVVLDAVVVENLPLWVDYVVDMDVEAKDVQTDSIEHLSCLLFLTFLVVVVDDEVES